jgi:predicted outer membrane repeat protein
LPYVDESLYVEGLGAGSLTVNGNSHRIFFVNPPGPAEFKLAKITLSGAAGLDGPAINVIDGDANGSTGGPSLAVESAILTGNSSSGRGGAISAAAGSVLVRTRPSPTTSRVHSTKAGRDLRPPLHGFDADDPELDDLGEPDDPARCGRRRRTRVL